ncbi:hypothetical protein E2542_SST01564 [Spatholobus suberectus]|nr:hypothetical protein E2542_SST01564 [Spatholobus suberectus]
MWEKNNGLFTSQGLWNIVLPSVFFNSFISLSLLVLGCVVVWLSWEYFKIEVDVGMGKTVNALKQSRAYLCPMSYMRLDLEGSSILVKKIRGRHSFPLTRNADFYNRSNKCSPKLLRLGNRHGQGF